MGTKTQQLVETLERLVPLLESYGDTWWSSWFAADLVRIREGDRYGVEHVLQAFGGMGSFNDLFLHPRNGNRVDENGVEAANRALSELRSRAWSLAREISRESTKSDR